MLARYFLVSLTMEDSKLHRHKTNESHRALVRENAMAFYIPQQKEHHYMPENPSKIKAKQSRAITPEEYRKRDRALRMIALATLVAVTIHQLMIGAI